jgi:hypothetical protein
LEKATAGDGESDYGVIRSSGASELPFAHALAIVLIRQIEMFTMHAGLKNPRDGKSSGQKDGLRPWLTVEILS